MEWSSKCLIAVAFVVCLFAVTQAAQCSAHSDNPCMATCNGTTFDISKVFDYPLENMMASYIVASWPVVDVSSNTCTHAHTQSEDN